MGNKLSIIKRNMNFLKQDMLPSGVKVEVFSNKEAIIEGCKGIMEYNEEYIKLNIGCGSIVFTGKGLFAYSYFCETLVIKGRINNIEYCVVK